jgi:hypothetical protein
LEKKTPPYERWNLILLAKFPQLREPRANIKEDPILAEKREQMYARWTSILKAKFPEVQ